MLDLSLCISPINVDCRQTTICTKTILSVLEALINVFLIQIFRYLFGRNDDLLCCLIVYFLYRNSILLHNSLISHSLNSPLIFLNRHFNRNNCSLSICFFNYLKKLKIFFHNCFFIFNKKKPEDFTLAFNTYKSKIYPKACSVLEMISS